MKTEQDFFDEIGNVLHAHEDAYVPGAWEEFVNKRKRRPGLMFFRIAAAASVLLMLGYAIWLFVPSQPVNTKNNQTKNTKKPPYIYPNTNPGHDSLVTDNAVVSQKVDGEKPSALLEFKPAGPSVNREPFATDNTAYLPPSIDKTDNGTQPANIPGSSVINNVVAATQPARTDSAAVVLQPTGDANANAAPIVKIEPRRYDRSTQRLNYDSLANLNKPKLPEPEKNKKARNLSYAVLVSPSVGNQKMNFGTGVEVAYNIGKNFSVSSGLSYAYVNTGASKSIPSPEATPNYSLKGFETSFASSSSAATLSNTGVSQNNVQGVKLALSGLEIPLSFQYKTKNGFYLSAGVSAMSVIGNNLSYDYVSSKAVNKLSTDGLTSTISVVTEETTQRSNENVSGYIGFYTLSAGKKISFGKGKLNFAPFIKVPFSRVSSENLQLMHGGVQLGFGF